MLKQNGSVSFHNITIIVKEIAGLNLPLSRLFVTYFVLATVWLCESPDTSYMIWFNKKNHWKQE